MKVTERYWKQMQNISWPWKELNFYRNQKYHHIIQWMELKIREKSSLTKGRNWKNWEQIVCYKFSFRKQNPSHKHVIFVIGIHH